MHIHVCVCAYMYLDVRVCIYIYIHVYMYILGLLLMNTFTAILLHATMMLDLFKLTVRGPKRQEFMDPCTQKLGSFCLGAFRNAFTRQASQNRSRRELVPS